MRKKRQKLVIKKYFKIFCNYLINNIILFWQTASGREKKANYLMFYEVIKNLKNQAYNKNKNLFVEKLKLPFALIDFWGYSESTEEDFAAFNGEIKDQFETFNHLSIDFFVCLMDSIDLLITGSWTNSASLLRIALKTTGIINYANTFDNYKEIRDRYVLRIKKPVFKKDKVFCALEELGKNDIKMVTQKKRKGQSIGLCCLNMHRMLHMKGFKKILQF